MKEHQITCDKCGLLIEPLDPDFNAHHVAGGGSLLVLECTNGGMGHNQIPFGGWHFHYLCATKVISAIRASVETKPESHAPVLNCQPCDLKSA